MAKEGSPFTFYVLLAHGKFGKRGLAMHISEVAIITFGDVTITLYILSRIGVLGSIFIYSFFE